MAHRDRGRLQSSTYRRRPSLSLGIFLWLAFPFFFLGDLNIIISSEGRVRGVKIGSGRLLTIRDFTTTACASFICTDIICARVYSSWFVLLLSLSHFFVWLLLLILLFPTIISRLVIIVLLLVIVICTLLISLLLLLGVVVRVCLWVVLLLVIVSLCLLTIVSLGLLLVLVLHGRLLILEAVRGIV